MQAVPSSRPIHIFGLSGFLLGTIGMISGLYSVYLRLFRGVDLSDTFLPNIAVFLLIMGLNLLVFGIIADICIKIYYKNDEPYLIEKIIK